MRTGGLLGAAEALADGRVVQVMQLAQDEGEPLPGGKPRDDALDPGARLATPHLALGPVPLQPVEPGGHGGRSSPPPVPRAEMIAPHIGRDGEEPGPHIGLGRQAAGGPEGAQEGLLREVIGIARARGDTQEIPSYLPAMRRHPRLEAILGHRSSHKTPEPRPS
jgi:hypothetical protein